MSSPSDPILENIANLAAQARALPTRPGVYLMKDAKETVLYIGKANSLRNRVGSYFVQSVDLGPRKQPMLNLIVDFDVIECESEWEALLTEARLIKDLRPRFNSMMLDDRTFPYLAITMRDDFPGVFITRTPSDHQFKGAKVFGPFTSVTALRESVQLLQRVYKYRTCTLDINADDPKNYSFRPCLLHAINQCTAPCANKITKDDYRRDIKDFTRFLNSKRSVMLRQMGKEMDEASENRQYERAAVLRDQIKAIEKLDDRDKKAKIDSKWQPEVTVFAADPSEGLQSLQKILGIDEAIRCLEAIDIAHLQGGETVGSKVCFIDGRPFKDGYRRYKIKTATASDDYMAIREVVSRRYRDAGDGNELYPDVILIDGGLGQLHAALEAFKQLEMKPPMVISLAKKEELIYVQQRSEPIKLGRENAGLKLCQAMRDEAHRFAQHYHHILRRKTTLDE